MRPYLVFQRNSKGAIIANGGVVWRVIEEEDGEVKGGEIRLIIKNPEDMARI